MKMKNIILVVAIIAFFSSCREEFLDRPVMDRIGDGVVFDDPVLVEAYLYKAYNQMPYGYAYRQYDVDGAYAPGMDSRGYGNTYMVDCNTDLMTNKSGWPESNGVIVPNGYTPDSNPLDNWEFNYNAIRFCNNMLNRLEVSELDADFVTRIKAESRFVRAYMYFDLARRYGDVPLITELQTLEDSLFVSRTPVAEVYDFIDAEFTEIAEDLPSKTELADTDLGRATKEACWAFNGRAMLYAKNYERSAEMSKKVIDAGVYSLSPNYNALFQSYGGDNEVIFEMLFNGTEKGHSMDRLAFPFSQRADWGSQILVTYELVKSYETTNGLSIDDDPEYDPNNPFKNRDSRLDATVLYHNSTFRTLPILTAISNDTLLNDANVDNDVDAIKSDSDAPQGDYYNAILDKVVSTRQAGNNTTTGFNLRKFMDEQQPLGPEFDVSKTSWKEMRLGEVLLNYAEAQNEVSGPDASVYDAIDQVRSRAGQPGLPSGLGQSEMFERIVQERKVELACEGHRYWDLRRWDKGVEVLDGFQAHGLFVIKDVYNNNALSYQEVVAINRPVQTYLEHFNLMPIPQSEMDKNPNLTQNEGY
jgi:hypothetical protein